MSDSIQGEGKLPEKFLVCTAHIARVALEASGGGVKPPIPSAFLIVYLFLNHSVQGGPAKVRPT